MCPQTSRSPQELKSIQVCGVWKWKTKLSDKINFPTVTPCDGDGLIVNIDINLANLLQNAGHPSQWNWYTRITRSPCCENTWFEKCSKRMGHISLCAVHLFLCMFVLTGTASCVKKYQRRDLIHHTITMAALWRHCGSGISHHLPKWWNKYSLSLLSR